MRGHVSSLYRLLPLQQLMAAESAAVQARMRAYAGRHGLQLSVQSEDPPPNLPLVRHWVQLYAQDGYYQGDLQLAWQESLPFHDAALDLVWLKHVLDLCTEPGPLLRETERLLAPGGMLVVSGLHPFSVWTLRSPWRSSGQRPCLHLPWKLRQLLYHAGLTVEASWRERGKGASGYVLIARKSSDQAQLTQLRFKRFKPVGAHAVSPSLRVR